MDAFTAADDLPLWGLTITEPAGPTDHVDELMTDLLDIQDDICEAVTWLAEHWAIDLPALRWGAGNETRGYALRLMAAVRSHEELAHVALVLDATVAAESAHANRVWWHATRPFGRVLLDVFYGEPIPADTAGYVAAYLDKAKRPGPEAGAA